MINEEKVKLMTKIASYESRVGKKDIEAMSYFRGDYISFNTFLILLGVSVSLIFFFLADLGEKLFGNLDRFVEIDFLGQGIEYFTVWLVFMVIYGSFCGVLYRNRYRASQRRIEHYIKWLKEVRKMS